MSGIIRAMRIDLIPLRSYLGLLSGLIALIIAFMGWISPDAMAGAVGGLPVFVLFIVGMQLTNQDDANGWSAYRLALPLSRRDIVLGRYLAIVLVTLACMAEVAIVGTLVPVVAGIFVDWQVAPTDWSAYAVTSAASLAIGFVLMGIYQPLAFKYGSEKMMKIYPIVMLVIILSPVLVMDIMGDRLTQAIDSALGLLATSGSTLGVTVALLACALLAAGVSALVSLRVYRTRDL